MEEEDDGRILDQEALEIKIDLLSFLLIKGFAAILEQLINSLAFFGFAVIGNICCRLG